MKSDLTRLANRLAILLVAALFNGGCVFHRPDQPARPTASLPDDLSQALAQQRHRMDLHESSDSLSADPTANGRSEAAYSKREITLTNEAAPGRAVQFDYYLPRSVAVHGPYGGGEPEGFEKLPAILVLPIMGGTNYDLESFFARSFAKRGFATVILHRPDIKAEVRELEEIDGLLLRSVEDARSTIDWLETRRELDAARIGLFGVSLGAIRGTLVLAADQRVRAGVLGLVGGDLPYILTHTTEKGLVRQRDKMLAARHLSLAEAETKLRRLIRCDPLRVAPAVDPSRVLMVIAAFDGSIPASTGWELRRKLGNPAAIELLSGHYSSVIYAPWLRWKAGKFFEQQLGAPARD